ncbi:hypothetical protein, partial [Sulfoacidibacillus thermotolerans]
LITPESAGVHVLEESAQTWQKETALARGLDPAIAGIGGMNRFGRDVQRYVHMDLFAKESNELDALREMNQESKVTALNTREASTAENVTSKAEVVGGASVEGTGEVVDVTGKANWIYIGSKDQFLRDNNYTQDAPHWTGDMYKSIVRNSNGDPIGEIHINQPEYDYNNKPKSPTGDYFPEHFQRYRTNGKLANQHFYFLP